MSKNTLITNSEKLTAEIGKTLKVYDTVHRRLHVLAVSALYVVANSGDVRPLNRLAEGLRQNDLQALRLYVRRAHCIIGLKGESPDGLASERVNSAELAGTVLGYKREDGFRMIVENGHKSANAKAFARLCQERFINPDGKTDMEVFERNNIEEIRTMGDADVLKSIVRVAKAESSDRRVFALSPKVRKFLDEILGKAETMVENMDLGETNAQAAARQRSARTSSTAPAKAARRKASTPALETAVAH